MASEAELLQLAACVYFRPELNRTPRPLGWDTLIYEPSRFTGFSAGAFVNEATNEIVISFTGTTDGAIDHTGGSCSLAALDPDMRRSLRMAAWQFLVRYTLDRRSLRIRARDDARASYAVAPLRALEP
jgi:hypothetical protein